MEDGPPVQDSGDLNVSAPHTCLPETRREAKAPLVNARAPRFHFQRRANHSYGRLPLLLLRRFGGKDGIQGHGFIIGHVPSNSSNSSHLMLVGNSEANPDYTRISELKYVNENSGAQSTSPHTLPNSFSKKFTTLNLKFCSVH